MKKLFLAAALVTSACASSTPPATTEHAADPATDGRRSALLEKHDEIWALMGLSKDAVAELNGIVVAVHGQMEKNKREKPEAFAHATEVKRAQGPMTREEYMANHKRRFDFLKISEKTQAELIGAAEFVWAALHDPDVAPEKKQTAETIQGMMRAMGGPPPCCDDNLFERASSN